MSAIPVHPIYFQQTPVLINPGKSNHILRNLNELFGRGPTVIRDAIPASFLMRVPGIREGHFLVFEAVLQRMSEIGVTEEKIKILRSALSDLANRVTSPYPTVETEAFAELGKVLICICQLGNCCARAPCKFCDRFCSRFESNLTRDGLSVANWFYNVNTSGPSTPADSNPASLVASSSSVGGGVRISIDEIFDSQSMEIPIDLVESQILVPVPEEQQERSFYDSFGIGQDEPQRVVKKFDPSKKGTIACRYGKSCHWYARKDANGDHMCNFYHPPTKVDQASAPIDQGLPETSAKEIIRKGIQAAKDNRVVGDTKICRSGKNCTNASCKFTHVPKSTKPADS
jgi:hypothetical protein